MERSEPSLVPEWLRSTGGGTGGGSSSHHFASLQTDGPVLALLKRNKTSKSNGYSDVPSSSLPDQSFPSNSRRSSGSNGLNKHDKNSYAQAYNSFTRSRDRDRESLDRERLTIADNWDSEYSDPLRSMVTGRTQDTLRCSQSMISRRQGAVLQQRISTDPRNGSSNIPVNGNGTHSVGDSVTGIQKVVFEKDFPMLGSDDRPKTPDIIRVSSPVLNRGIQSLSFGNSSLVGSDGWTSALVEVPTGAGSNGKSSPTLQSPAGHSASASASASACGSVSTLGVGTSVTGLNMAEALVQAPARSQNIPQTHKDELAIAQSKKLIPMTPSLPKTLVLNPSDKLKPKTPLRSIEAVAAPKNGIQQLSPLQLGSQSVRGTSVRVDGPKSSSPGKLLLLKPGRESGVSPIVRDVQSPTTNINTSRIANGQSTGVPSVASVPLKNPSKPRFSSSECKTSGYGSNPEPVVDKRSSRAQTQSRNDFFNLMRKKSMNNVSGASDSGNAVSSDIVDKSDREQKQVPDAQVSPGETGSAVKCAESSSHTKENDNAAIYPNEEEAAFLCSLGWDENSGVDEGLMEEENDSAAIYPNEEEVAFLRSLGWDENAGDEEGGLTEEEIKSFFEVLKHRPTSKQCRVLQPKILSRFEFHVACSGAASSEPSSSASQTKLESRF